MVTDVRRTNLKALLHEHFDEKIADLARAIERDDAYIWQLLNGDRNIGERTARHIEEKLKLGRGTLDVPGMVAAETLTPDEREILQKYRRASPRWRLSLQRLAEVRDEHQNEISETVNEALAKVFAKPAQKDQRNNNNQRTVHEPAPEDYKKPPN
jgi:plasmid maintenance system antidote protein VapI